MKAGDIIELDNPIRSKHYNPKRYKRRDRPRNSDYDYTTKALVVKVCGEFKFIGVWDV